MAETIFHTEITPFLAAPIWHVERQPEGVTDPMVVRFRKSGNRGNCLLDQNARWTPLGWDPKRWRPGAPRVPKWLLRKVEAQMLEVEA